MRVSMQIPAAQAGNGDNHAVSALKFRMLRHFLQLGYSVLLSDVVRRPAPSLAVHLRFCANMHTVLQCRLRCWLCSRIELQQCALSPRRTL